MGREGRWRLSPAFDVYAHNPAGLWTNLYQMSINGKRDRFTWEDLIEVGEAISIPKPRLILDQVLDAVKQWPQFAAKTGVGRGRAAEIGLQHRLQF